MWLARNLWYFFLAPGVLMLVAGGVTGFRALSFRQSAAKAPGTVIANRYSTDSDGVRKSSSRPPDGRRHKFVRSTGSSPASFKAGERVEVLHHEGAAGERQHQCLLPPVLWPPSALRIGLIFRMVGGIPLYLRRKSGQLAEWLKTNGRAIQADFTGAHLRTNFEVNGQNPYRISAQWKNPATNEIHVCYSEDLWYDPTPYMASKTVTVLIDPNNPKRYWMDTSFLPKLAR